MNTWSSKGSRRMSLESTNEQSFRMQPGVAPDCLLTIDSMKYSRGTDWLSLSKSSESRLSSLPLEYKVERVLNLLLEM